MPDYIPHTDEGLLTWGANFSTRLPGIATRLGIPAIDVDALQGQIRAIQTTINKVAECKALANAAVKAKDDLLATSLPAIRQLVQRIKKSKGYTEATEKSWV